MLVLTNSSTSFSKLIDILPKRAILDDASLINKRPKKPKRRSVAVVTRGYLKNNIKEIAVMTKNSRTIVRKLRSDANKHEELNVKSRMMMSSGLKKTNEALICNFGTCVF